MGASGGYGYYVIVLEDDADDADDTDDNPKSSSPPIARINPSNPKIQANETILFSASDSTDSDGDTLTFTWTFEGDSEQYSNETIERTYLDGGDFDVILLVTDSTGLTDETETTVSVVEDYHAEHDSGNDPLDEGEEAQFEFPVQSGAVSVSIVWVIDGEGTCTINTFEDCLADLALHDSEGNPLENETVDTSNCSQNQCDVSWTVDSDRLESVGTYEISIECKEGSVSYNVTIDVSY